MLMNRNDDRRSSASASAAPSSTLTALDPMSKVTNVSHSWAPCGTLLSLYSLSSLTWFAGMIASVSYNNQDTVLDTNGLLKTPGATLSLYSAYINLFCFRTISLFLSIIVIYHSDRHFLSRGAAWLSNLTNLLFLFSFLSIDLPFVYSSLVSYTNTTSTPPGSMNAFFCSGSMPSHICSLALFHGSMSVISTGFLFLGFLYSCYQLARARGNSKLILTWPEVTCVNLTTFAFLGYLVWTCSSIRLSTSENPVVFNYLDPNNILGTSRMVYSSLIWGNYLIHTAFILSMASVAFISFGGTITPRLGALLLNWLSFFTLFPAFVYLVRHQQQGQIGQCSNHHRDNTLECPSLDGIAVGMGICVGCNLLIGCVMFAVMRQAETADFAIDMYGHQALALKEDPRTSFPMTKLADSIAETRPSTPHHGTVQNPLPGSSMPPTGATASGLQYDSSAPTTYTEQNLVQPTGPSANPHANRRDDVGIEIGRPIY